VPQFSYSLCRFLYFLDNPNADPDHWPLPEDCPEFFGHIRIHHAATATFFAPSDLCGAGGMLREYIRSTPSYRGHPRYDTVFVITDQSHQDSDGLHGIEVARVRLFFSFTYRDEHFVCALVNWFGRDDCVPDSDTGMWVVSPDEDDSGSLIYEVISVRSIARGAHLLPIFGTDSLPERFDYRLALDSFQSFFVNHFVDHRAHEFIVG